MKHTKEYGIMNSVLWICGENSMNDDTKNVFSLFFDETPITDHLIDTSRGDADFRATFIIETAAGSKYALKLADNDFTFPEKISVWQRTVEE